MKIPIKEWAKKTYSPAPCRNTLYKWIAEARISPMPEFIGRGYFVEENAKYVGDKIAAPRRPDLRKRRLVDRISSDLNAAT